MQWLTLVGLVVVRASHDAQCGEACAAKRSVQDTQGTSMVQRHLESTAVFGIPKKVGQIIPGSDTSRPAETKVSDDTSICEKDIFARPELCPNQCPYAAEMTNNFCHFRCVQKHECGLLKTVANATIPDEKLRTCRHCAVEGCMTCVAALPGQVGEKLERCKVCMLGYTLTEEGECAMKGLWIFTSIAVVFAVFALAALWWYVSLLRKPCVNQVSIDFAYECRSRAMVLQRGEPGVEPRPYSLGTNLMTTNVAGPGTMCLFRFQFAILIWAMTLLVAWLILAAFSSTDVLTIGRLAATTPQMLCAVVSWGRHRQLDLLWVKVSWLTFAYLFSFVGAMIYAIQQARLFGNINTEEKTVSDFVAQLKGLPPLKGKDLVEDALKEAVARTTGTTVVGVSVAWDYDARGDEVQEAIEREFALSEQHEVHFTAHDDGATARLNTLSSKITDALLHAWHIDVDVESRQPPSSEKIKDMLQNFESTSTAFVVFATEEDRDNAIDYAQRAGIQVNGQRCSLRAQVCEPEEVLWPNFAVTSVARGTKMIMSSMLVVVACLAWTVLLYLPYAHYMSSFSYANGDEPGEFSEILFVALVVGSQIGLFVCSSIGAGYCRFIYKDWTQQAYTMFYNSALILNLALDIVLQAYLSYLQMVGTGAHTDDGRLLGSLTDMQQIFESYPMQKSLGNLLFKYCWPCTFFVPFLFEPIISIWFPQHIGRLLIGANPKIHGELAERALELSEMEQGRYADCIFNTILVTCIPFVSPAYLHITLIAFIVSHIFLYSFDQVKTLRYVGQFTFSSPAVNMLGMKLFAIPVSILAGTLVFKANQMSAGGDLGGGFLRDRYLLLGVVGAMAAHCVLHLLLLAILTRCCAGGSGGSHDGITYTDIAKLEPATFFSTNPVHCLRSKYIHKHNPPQAMFAPGKSHLMKANPKIGSCYEYPKSTK